MAKLTVPSIPSMYQRAGGVRGAAVGALLADDRVVGPVAADHGHRRLLGGRVGVGHEVGGDGLRARSQGRVARADGGCDRGLRRSNRN